MKKFSLVFLSLLFLSGLCFTDETEMDSLSAVNDFQVLIASSRSDFKEALVEQLLEKLKDIPAEYTIIDLKGLKEIDSNDFDAIVILNKIWAWHLEGKVRKFLKGIDVEKRGKIIVLSTAGDPNFQAKEEGIIAITSASETTEAPEIADEIFSRLMSVLYPE